MWTCWILASAVFLAFYDLAKKASVRENAVLPVLLLATVAGGGAYVAVLGAAGGIPAALDVSARDLSLICIKSAIVSTSWVLTYCALRSLPITIATPIRASAPAIVFIAAFFLYGEQPTILQGLGITLVFAGSRNRRIGDVIQKLNIGMGCNIFIHSFRPPFLSSLPAQQTSMHTEP